MADSAPPVTERFSFPCDRDTRASLLAEQGLQEVPADGQPLTPGTFRRIDSMGYLYLRIAFPEATVGPKVDNKPVPAPKCRWCNNPTRPYRGAGLASGWRWCPSCGRTTKGTPNTKRAGRHITPEKAAQVEELLRKGWSLRGAAAEAGVSKMAVVRRAKTIERERCPCGRAAQHRGWCRPRIAQSPAAQAALAASSAKARAVYRASQPDPEPEGEPTP